MPKCLPGPLAPHSVSSYLKISLPKFFIFLLSSITLASEANQCIFAKNGPMISGRITDSTGKPIPHVSVRLWLEDLGLSSSQLSDANGYFEIEHKLCKSCTLEVVPNQNKGLASALIERIPGDSTRKIIVELKNGFLVCGRVIHDGKGLNGIALRVFASGHDNASHSQVHGGGTALTKKDGSYSLILTPGPKTLVAVNNHYKIWFLEWTQNLLSHPI